MCQRQFSVFAADTVHCICPVSLFKNLSEFPGILRSITMRCVIEIQKDVFALFQKFVYCLALCFQLLGCIARDAFPVNAVSPDIYEISGSRRFTQKVRPVREAQRSIVFPQQRHDSFVYPAFIPEFKGISYLILAQRLKKIFKFADIRLKFRRELPEDNP